MEEYKEELATIESIDSGAVYTLALKTHVGMSIDTFRYFAGWCDKIQVKLLLFVQDSEFINLVFHWQKFLQLLVNIFPQVTKVFKCVPFDTCAIILIAKYFCATGEKVAFATGKKFTLPKYYPCHLQFIPTDYLWQMFSLCQCWNVPSATCKEIPSHWFCSQVWFTHDAKLW